MARCQKCYSKIRKLAGNPGKGGRWGCRKCTGVLKLRERYISPGDPFTRDDRRLLEILKKTPLNHH